MVDAQKPAGKGDAEQQLADSFLDAVGGLVKSAAAGSTSAQTMLDILTQRELAQIAILEAQLLLTRTECIMRLTPRFMALPDTSETAPKENK